MKYLKKGDKIGIVATARAIEKKEIFSTIEWLKSVGFVPVFLENCFKKHHQFAGTDAERAAILQQYISDAEIHAIWCARGGYGSVRILDLVNFLPLIAQQKCIIGYSDITAIHTHLWSKYKHFGLHGVMPINITQNDSAGQSISLASLENCLKGEIVTYIFPNHPLNIVGNAEGILVGGNLSVIYSLMGSESEIETDNCILFLEDLDEYLYHIDRMTVCLKRAKKFDQVKGLIIGGMTKMNENAIPFGKTAEEIIYEHTSNFDFPIYFGFDAGHTEINLTLRLGKMATISNNQLILQP